MNEQRDNALTEDGAEIAHRRLLGEVPLLGLDVDGVLNFGETWGRGLSADKLDLVAWIYRATGCEVSLITDRRYRPQGCRQVVEGLIERGVGHPALISVLPVHLVVDGQMVRETERETAAMVERHGLGIYAGRIADWSALLAAEPRRAWVVIDDQADPWRTAGVEARVWAPDPQRGLTLWEAERVVAMMREPQRRGNVQPLKAEEGEGRQECHPSLAPTLAEVLASSKMRLIEGGLV